MTQREYDAELGRITEDDRSHAADILCDISDSADLEYREQTVAEWVRKIRYEAVMADRKRRNAIEQQKGV